MIATIKTPRLYYSKRGAINEVGDLVKGIGKNVFIIWTEHSKKAVETNLIRSLAEANITYEEVIFSGYPTFERAKDYAELVRKNNSKVILAVGGGKICDVSKAAGDLVNVPVVAVPTIAATCAPWAALSVLYTKEGDFEQFRVNNNSPAIVISDSEVIANAPIRYIRAGIVDTLAKWYETSLKLGSSDQGLIDKNALSGARQAYELLNSKSIEVVKKIENNQIDEDVEEVIDSIFYLAGNVGSYVGEKAFSGFAHPFYHSSRIIESTRQTLHGELVAFGLILQAVLEGKSDEDLKEIIEFFSDIKVAFTLEDIGLKEDSEKKLFIIANRILKEFPNSAALTGEVVASDIVAGALRADEYVKKYRKGIV